jgi:hypothetical protein
MVKGKRTAGDEQTVEKRRTGENERVENGETRKEKQGKIIKRTIKLEKQNTTITSADNANAIPYQTCTKPRKRVGKYVNKLRAVYEDPLCDDDYDLEEDGEFDGNPDQDDDQDYLDYEDDYEGQRSN